MGVNRCNDYRFQTIIRNLLDIFSKKEEVLTETLLTSLALKTFT